MIDREPNTIYLTGFVREAVLAAITKWIDPVFYLNEENSLRLRKIKGSRYLGKCPWCGKAQSLEMNIKTTKAACTSCGEDGDFIDLVKEERAGTTADALNFLSGLAEAYKKQAAKRKAEARTQQRDKKRFGASYKQMKETGAAL